MKVKTGYLEDWSLPVQKKLGLKIKESIAKQNVNRSMKIKMAGRQRFVLNSEVL